MLEALMESLRGTPYPTTPTPVYDCTEAASEKWNCRKLGFKGDFPTDTIKNSIRIVQDGKPTSRHPQRWEVGHVIPKKLEPHLATYRAQRAHYGLKVREVGHDYVFKMCIRLNQEQIGCTPARSTVPSPAPPDQSAEDYMPDTNTPTGFREMFGAMVDMWDQQGDAKDKTNTEQLKLLLLAVDLAPKN